MLATRFLSNIRSSYYEGIQKIKLADDSQYLFEQQTLLCVRCLGYGSVEVSPHLLQLPYPLLYVDFLHFLLDYFVSQDSCHAVFLHQVESLEVLLC